MQNNGASVTLRMQSIMPALGKAEQAVALYIMKNSEILIRLPITELAERTQTSEATVVRVCQKAGFRGYQDLKISLAQEMVTPLESIHAEIIPDDDAKSVLAKVFNGTIETLQFTQKVVSSEQLKAAVEKIVSARFVDVYGLGNSASVAMDCHHKLSRSGIKCRLGVDNHLQMIYASTVMEEDVVIGISHSGSSRDVVEALSVAREHGATIICITNYSRSPIVKVSDICLFTASEETRFRILGLASRIAQLAIIDTIHTLIALKDTEKFSKTTQDVLNALQQKMY